MRGNLQLDQTKESASSHGRRFHSCKHWSVRCMVAQIRSPKTRNPPHLSLALPHFLSTSAHQYFTVLAIDCILPKKD